jgi:PncC family amidohydrolase
VYGEGDTDLAAVVLDLARQRGAHVGTAESCTGGLVGTRLTEIPGSSDVYSGGVVAYSNDLKTSLLGVPASLIDTHGAVSEPVVLAMAAGAIERLGVDLAVAVTGVAGPGGGSEEKPVGTVWFGVATPGSVEAKKVLFPGTRHDIRSRGAQAALFLLARALRRD